MEPSIVVVEKPEKPQDDEEKSLMENGGSIGTNNDEVNPKPEPNPTEGKISETFADDIQNIVRLGGVGKLLLKGNK